MQRRAQIIEEETMGEAALKHAEETWVYAFGGGTADGDASMKNLLGGKGANLAEMVKSWHSGTAGLHDQLPLPASPSTRLAREYDSTL
jgi:pyruvate,orthophosphate dikinase